MTSTIYLYKDSKIIPSKNFVVESIETYLAGLTYISITNFQYLRNDLNLTIKINKSQDFTDSVYTYNYNYVKVVQNSVNYYYFVVKKTQISQNTIALELVMDTLNTYKWDTDFKISKRTRVLREHKDRLIGLLTFMQARNAGNELETITKNVEYPGTLVFTKGVQTIEVGATLIKKQPSPIITTYDFYIDKEDQESIFFLRDSNEWDLHLFYTETYPDGIYQLDDYISTLQQVLYKVVRKIDYYSEGISPNLYKKELGQITQKENTNWNLVYKNDNQGKISCFAIPSNEGLNFNTATAGTLTYTDFADGVYYNFCPYNINGEVQNLVLKDNADREYYVKRDPNQWNMWTIKQVYRSGSTLKIRSIKGIYNPETGAFNPILGLTIYGWITITSLSFNSEKAYYRTSNTGPTTGNLDAVIYPSNGSFSNSMSASEIKSLQNVDRYEPELVKIIEIPYFPSSYEYDADNALITTDSTWTYSAGEKSMVLNNLNTQFSNEIVSSISNPLKVLIYKGEYEGSFNPSSSDLRNDELESKLLHSDYYQPKFVYDSFGFIFQLEKLDEFNFEPSNNFTFEFIMTSTINSKFMFKFSEYVLKLSEVDFDNVLPVARNNEAPIYNSAYIDYLATAYNYDLKSKKLTSAMLQAGGIAGLGAGVAQAIAGGMSENWGQFASGLVKMVASPLAAAVALEQKQLNWDKNLNTLKKQADSVSGSDDIDLLNAYCGNKAKLCLYQVSDRVKSLLADLFYYYGYTTDEIKIPTLNTRYWFNFVSCELELTGLDKNISDVCKENLIQRYRDGATFLHEHNSNWDFDQIKENWEVSLL